MDLTLCCASIPFPQSFSSGSEFKVIQKFGAIASKLKSPIPGSLNKILGL